MGRRLLLVAAVIAALFAAGCGGGGGPRFSDRDSGVTMTLPAGWVQSGNMAFEDPDWDTPSLMVFLMPMEGADLKSHVDKVLQDNVKMSDAMKGMASALGNMVGGEAKEQIDEDVKALDTTFTPPKSVKIGGADAFEAVVKTPVLTSIYVYVVKDSSVVEVMFRAETAKWPEYEPVFRKSLETVKVK